MCRNGEGVWVCSEIYCRNWGVPFKLVRARLYSSQPGMCSLPWMGARWQRFLRLREWTKGAINTLSITPAGLHTLPLLEAQLVVVAVRSLQLEPPLHPHCARSLCHLLTLFWPRRLSLNTPGFLPWESLFQGACFVLWGWKKSPSSKNMSSWERKKMQYCLNDNNCLLNPREVLTEIKQLPGLGRCHCVLCAISKCPWVLESLLVLERFPKAVVEDRVLGICHGDHWCNHGQNVRLTRCFFPQIFAVS